MSSYLEFYIKHDDRHTLLLSFSRSNKIYEAFDETVYPSLYGNGVVCSESLLSNVVGELSKECDAYEATKKEYEKLISSIERCNNSLEEKAEEIFEDLGSIRSINEEIEEIKNAISICNVMSLIVDDAKYIYKEEDFLWVGIDWSPGQESEEE